MKKPVEKPTTEAKALSLFLMAFKSIEPMYKEKLKRINRQWDLVTLNEISKNTYAKEVQAMLVSFGGYKEVVEKTVKYYIDKTGEWNATGDDKYSADAQKIADKLLKKK